MNKNIITLEGYDAITKKFNILIKEKEYWVEEKRIAALQGDRSENAEYISAKENIRNIDKQLFKINNILNKIKMVDISKRTNFDIVLFGSRLKIETNDNEIKNIRIVGTHELIYIQKETDDECISNISPLGKRLIKSEVGNIIEIGEYTYKILEIKEN